MEGVTRGQTTRWQSIRCADELPKEVCERDDAQRREALVDDIDAVQAVPHQARQHLGQRGRRRDAVQRLPHLVPGVALAPPLPAVGDEREARGRGGGRVGGGLRVGVGGEWGVGGGGGVVALGELAAASRGGGSPAGPLQPPLGAARAPAPPHDPPPRTSLPPPAAWPSLSAGSRCTAYPAYSVPCSSARNSPTGSAREPKCSAMMVRISLIEKLPMMAPPAETTATAEMAFSSISAITSSAGVSGRTWGRGRVVGWWVEGGGGDLVGGGVATLKRHATPAEQQWL